MKDIGFVYEWLDLSNGKKYIGSHKGTPDDGYTGSGTLFMRAYNKRPDDFYRFIRYCGPNYREAEELLLNSVDAMHNDEYYNLKNSAVGGFDYLSDEERKKARSRGGNTNLKNKTGLFGRSKEKISRDARMGGKISVWKMLEKRDITGENNSMSILTNEEAKFIRKVYFKTKNQYDKLPKGKMTTKQLMDKFNVPKDTILKIVQYKTYKNI